MAGTESALPHPGASRRPFPTRGRVAAAAAFGNKESSGMSLPAEQPTPDPADELPFWRRKAMKDMTPAE